MPLASRMFAAFLVLAALALPAAASAQQPQAASAQVAWRLLDYIAVDYPAAVADGRVISAAEYAEMREFSASVRERLAALPARSATPQLPPRPRKGRSGPVHRSRDGVSDLRAPTLQTGLAERHCIHRRLLPGWRRE